MRWGLSLLSFLPQIVIYSISPLLRWSNLHRTADTHKGKFGSIAIFGGAAGMLGAPLLAGRAALKLGAGKVRLGFLADNFPALDLCQPEIMIHAASTPATHPDKTLLVVGPGLGQEEAASISASATVTTTSP